MKKHEVGKQGAGQLRRATRVVSARKNGPEGDPTWAEPPAGVGGQVFQRLVARWASIRDAVQAETVGGDGLGSLR